MNNNKKWAKESIEKDPEFFSRLVNIQTPQFLWIGCSDSRVPANEIVGLKPGEVFVHRNVANQVPPSDINALAVIQYSVQVLKVKDILVTGHYGCGGIRAAFRKHDHGPLEAWLSHVRDIRARYKKELVLSAEENENLLTELNVKTQVYNIAKIPIVQLAWKNGQELRIHGFVYDLKDGLLKDMGVTLDSLEKIPEEYRVIE
jgi:carbonic anhydrase